jgi:3-methylfumaryl-CoA hydratase
MSAADEAGVVVRSDVCALAAVRRIAAMLDLDPDSLAFGDFLPRGWHFFLLAGETQRSQLRDDGFPGLGVHLPNFGLPRLLLGGRTVVYRRDLVIGAPVKRRSRLSGVAEKDGRTGRMVIVKVQHELTSQRDGGVCDPDIVEEQSYFLLGAVDETKADVRPVPVPTSEHPLSFTPDETLLFQYSALGFNSHRIHIDRDYAKNVEGLPDLVVNGGLSTLLMTEVLRNELHVSPRALVTRHVAPLYCGRPMAVTSDRSEEGWSLKIFDDLGQLAVTMEVEV